MGDDADGGDGMPHGSAGRALSLRSLRINPMWWHVVKKALRVHLYASCVILPRAGVLPYGPHDGALY